MPSKVADALPTRAPSPRADFDALAEDASPLLHLARSGRLQREAAERADAVAARLDQARLQAILAADEAKANGMLALLCLTRALASELQTYLLLKADEPERAWDMLVSAQEDVDRAMRADARLRGFVAKAAQLRALEDRLFPPQIFTSAGLLARRQRCSVCGADYDACGHVAGRAYMGRFCSAVPIEVSMDHVGVVEEPADRRCRFTSRGVPGVGMRNLMTWEVAPCGEGRPTPEERMEAVVLRADD